MTWFQNSLRDLIGFESADFPELGRSINIDRARTRGLETSARVLTGPVDARVAWTVLDATSHSEPDPGLARLIRRPRHTVNGDVGVELGARGLVGAGILVVASREDSDFNAFPAARVDPGDYALGRLYGSLETGRGIGLRARVENLFNTRYEPVFGFPGLGRYAIVSASVAF
jgi:outer membrane cobalamin receptor